MSVAGLKTTDLENKILNFSAVNIQTPHDLTIFLDKHNKKFINMFQNIKNERLINKLYFLKSHIYI